MIKMIHKPNEQKIKSFLKRLNEVHIDASKNCNLTKIAEICKNIFTIESEESIDEAFGVNINESVYYDTECDGQVMDCDTDENISKISTDYEDNIERLEDNLEIEFKEEDKIEIKREINRAKAEVIIEMNRALNDHFVDTFQKSVEKVCEEFKIQFDHWEEYGMTFIIDGKRWDWCIWDNYITFNDEEQTEIEEISLDDDQKCSMT